MSNLMKNRNKAFITMLVGCVLASLLQTALSTVLPVMMKEFRITASTAQWLTSAYSLVMGIMMPATAFLIRRFPTKKLFTAGMVIFLAGIILDAVVPTFSLILVGRLLQAAGNGIVLAVVQIVILTIYPVEKRGQIMGIYGLATVAAPVVAPMLAGIVVDHTSWRFIFAVAGVIAVAVLIAAQKTVRDYVENAKERFDIRSMFLCAIGFTGILISMGDLGNHAFFSLYVIVPLIIGIVCLILFSLRQFTDRPFLRIQLMRNREFRLSVIASMLLYAITIASSTILPLYVQTMRGFSATVSGIVILPGSLALALMSLFAGRIYDKQGIKKLFIFGSLGIMLSCAALSHLTSGTSLVYVAVLFTIRALCIGFLMMPLNTWGLSTMDKADYPDGTALLALLRTIAGAISAAIFVAIMQMAASRYTDKQNITADISGLNVSFVCLTVVSVLLFVVAFISLKKEKRNSMGNDVGRTKPLSD